MRIAFRTEGNHRQGMGDVMGCLAIAEHCRCPEDAVLFVISGGEAAIHAIGRHGHRVEIASDEDAQISAVRRFNADAVVVNMLNTPPRSIRALRGAAPLVVTLDDASDGAREADLRVNVLYHTADAITDLSYVALREEFQRAHANDRTIATSVNELLVMQGGADTYGFLPKIVTSLSRSALRAHVTVIIGPAFIHERELEAAILQLPLEINLVRNCTTMAEVMQRADLAITAGGLSMFELACVGTPSIVVCAERFENETADRLQRAGIVRNLGFGGDVSGATIADAVSDLSADVETRRAMSERGRAAIDGLGANRIGDLIRTTVAERRSLA